MILVPQVVGIEESDPVAAGTLDSQVASGIASRAGRGAMQPHEPWIVEPGEDFGAAISRGIVDEDDFMRREGLCERAPDGGGNVPRLVVNRDDD
jgi:hypothetical protein